MKKGKERIDYLRRIGMSDQIIQMAQGEILHDFLRSYEEPHEIYELSAMQSDVSLIAPIWAVGDYQTVVTKKDNNILICEFEISSFAETFRLLGYTDQAPLANLFLDAIEVSNDEDIELIKQIKQAASTTGFEHAKILVDLIKQANKSNGNYFDNFDALRKKIDW